MQGYLIYSSTSGNRTTLHEARLSAQRRGTKYGNETGWYAGYLVDGAGFILGKIVLL